MSIKKISIIAPVCNEVDNINPFYSQIKQEFALFESIDFEIIFIDDGSNDGSLEKLLQIADIDTSVTVIELSRNFGKDFAVMAGIDHIQADAAIIIDTDLQFPVRYIPKLVKAWLAGADVVVAKKKQESILAKIFFFVFNLLCVHSTVEPGITDFQLIDKVVFSSLRKLREHHLFLRANVKWLGFKREIIHCEISNRNFGKSKFTFVNLFLYGFRGILNFGSIGVRLFLYIAVIACYINTFIVLSTPDLGVVDLIKPIIFILALIGLLLIIIGEYTIMIYKQSQNRPLYIIRRVYQQQQCIL